jgi:multiple sugar transport system permease protein
MNQRARNEAMWGYIFVAAPLLGFVLFSLGPMVASLYLSFTEYDILTPPRWVGGANYHRLATSDPFLAKTLWNTLVYFIGIPIGILISLLMAMAVNRKMRGQEFFRTVYFLPSVCSAVALALIWKWLYNSDYGLINTTLQQLGVMHPPRWLDDPAWVKPALIILSVWATVGYNMLLFLAALQNVPRHLYEAADLDGATPWQVFWKVTFPLISPTTFFVLVMGIIGGFQNFDLVYISTRGGPEYASATYMIYLYQNGFQYYRMGYASALAWVLTAVILVVTWLQFRLSSKWVHYES